MKKFHYILCLLSTFAVFSQTVQEPLFHFDENWNHLSKEEFKEKLNTDNRYSYKFFENDTARIGRLFLVQQVDTISSEKRKKVIETLQMLSNQTVANDDTIVINFFFEPEKPPNGCCIDYYTSNKKYRKYFRKNKALKQFYITEKGYKYDKKFVLQDANDAIRSLLFPY